MVKLIYISEILLLLVTLAFIDIGELYVGLSSNTRFVISIAYFYLVYRVFKWNVIIKNLIHPIHLGWEFFKCLYTAPFEVLVIWYKKTK